MIPTLPFLEKAKPCRWSRSRGGGGEGEQAGQRTEKLLFLALHWWAPVIAHLSNPAECTESDPSRRPRPPGDDDVPVRLIACHQGTALGPGADSGKGCSGVGAGDTREVSIPSQFCREPKTALKTKVLFKKKNLTAK